MTFVVDVLKFDNSHSWTHSKEVFYSIKLTLPNADSSTTLRQRPVSMELESASPRDSEVVHDEDSRSLYFTPSPGPSLSPAESKEEIF